MGNEKLQTKAPLFTDSLAIAGGSALAYVSSFLFEKGYADYFGVPASLISPSLTTVLVSAAAIGGVLLWLALMSPLYTYILVASESPTLVPYRFVLRQLAVLVMIGILSVAMFGWKLSVLLALGTGGMLLLLLALSAFLLADRGGTIRERFARHAENQDRDVGYALVDRFKRAVGPHGSWLVVLCVMVLYVAYGAGYAQAVSQVNFPMIKADPNVAMLRMYGDLMIGVRVDRATRRPTGELVVSWLSEKKTVEFRLEAIGPLHQAEPSGKAGKALTSSPAISGASHAISRP